ncbi:hypothetical protein EYC84_006113 [Monilinia fructicola]|uniref:S1 motif domain-containing protein n=1 Tax=Monilinia fructicola TaxID=38448 RepID=A0A5M9K2B7_MONFR|nr:hypothetical protein EYC84_006113 [Monilinia fructicola]
MSLTNCRFYEEKYPEIDSFVMVNVKQIAEMGAYVKLLEYDNIDGMILLSELSRRLDKEKGYIDLSKRRVSPEDIKYGHAVDAFKLSITNADTWQDVSFPNECCRRGIKIIYWKTSDTTTNKKLLKPETRQIIKSKSSLSLHHSTFSQAHVWKSKLVSQPWKPQIVDIRKNIEAAGGNLIVKMEPKAVTENDDAELQALMEKRERENAEVSGMRSMSESDENQVEVMLKGFHRGGIKKHSEQAKVFGHGSVCILEPEQRLICK